MGHARPDHREGGDGTALFCWLAGWVASALRRGGGSEGYGRATWFGSGAGGAGIAVLGDAGEPFLSAAFQEVAAGGRRRLGHAGLPCRVQGPDQNTILLAGCDRNLSRS